MISFDYLHNPKPALFARVTNVRVPERLVTPLYALAAAVAIVLGAWGIEAYRLHAVLALQDAYQQQDDESARALSRTKILYGRLEDLVGLDRQVQTIARSGDADARRLAEIANRLPAHAWLTSISRDATGIALEGRAADLTTLSRAVSALSHSNTLRDPTLLGASAISETGGAAVFKYSMHIDGDAP